jgi:hypothetical protein
MPLILGGVIVKAKTLSFRFRFFDFLFSFFRDSCLALKEDALGNLAD